MQSELKNLGILLFRVVLLQYFFHVLNIYFWKLDEPPQCLLFFISNDNVRAVHTVYINLIITKQPGVYIKSQYCNNSIER